MALRAIRLNRDPVLYRKCREVEQVTIKFASCWTICCKPCTQPPTALRLRLRRWVCCGVGGNRYGRIKRRCAQTGQSQIIHKQGRQVCDEGCLSFPDQWAQTVRPYQVTVQALDENGQEIQLTGEGELAQCFCHELDHLDGIVFLQRAIKTSPAAPSKGRRRQNRKA